MPFNLFEASDRTGGNARTLRWEEFRYDTGAHRFHDKVAAVTADAMELLGSDLKEVSSPSQIIYHNKYVDFPLSPLNLAAVLGPVKLMVGLKDLISARISNSSTARSLADYATRAYGRTVAEEFLLGYSEKLWGAPAAELLPEVSGKRLKGLNLMTLFVEAVRGGRAKTEHLDGRFYYPKYGIGQLMDRLAEVCGEERIKLQSKVTKIRHQAARITAIEINNRVVVPADHVLSTLPLNLLAQLLDPVPPPAVIEAARTLRFRHVLLVTVFLKRERVTANASLYIPHPDIPITRISEPRNRSPHMSPPGYTSLSAELPCSIQDKIWMCDETDIQRQVIAMIESLKLLRPAEVIGSALYRIPYAYPVLEIGSDQAAKTISDYLSQFENLVTVGRNALFEYSHIHDLMASARQEIERITPILPSDYSHRALTAAGGTAM